MEAEDGGCGPTGFIVTYTEDSLLKILEYFTIMIVQE